MTKCPQRVPVKLIKIEDETEMRETTTTQNPTGFCFREDREFSENLK